MESNKIAVLENKLPLRAYPEKELDGALNTVFKFWLAKLLSIKAENEEKLDDALPAIKKHFWSLGMDQIKKAFEMYADGELQTKPIPNYFDRILVGHIFKEYRFYQKQNQKPKQDYDQEKETKDFLYCVQAFDYFEQNTSLPEQAVWLYEYLNDHKGVLNVSKREKQISYNLALEKYENKDMAVLKSKLWLVERYFNYLITKEKHVKDEI